MTSRVARVRWLEWVIPALVLAAFFAFAISRSDAASIGGFVSILIWPGFVGLLENRLSSGESAELELQRAHARVHSPGDRTLSGERLLLERELVRIVCRSLTDRTVSRL
jgi:hypothetical protein